MSQAGDSRPTDAPITDVDESTRITTDLPCMKCGYNLRTLPLAGRCPECGVPVERTTRGNLLRFSDPKWIAGLSGGVQCWLAALLVFLLGISLAAITIGLGARAKAGRFIVVPTMTTVGVLALVGLWKLTSPEPDRLKHPSRMSVGTVARYAASASCVLTAVNTCATISDASLDLLSEVAVFLTVAGTIVAFLIHLQQLAARLPHPRLVKRMRQFTWLAAATMTCCFGSVFAPLIIERLAAARLPLAPQGYLGNLIIELVTRILGFAVVAGEFACVPFGAVLILRYRQAFEGAAKNARSTWAASAVC